MTESHSKSKNVDSKDSPNAEPKDASSGDSKAEFPVADIREKSAGFFRASNMWWATLICLLLAAYLTWMSIPKSGPVISIQFPQGHGLKHGDSVRYRGIEVGRVIDVKLNAQLTGVDVRVMLHPGEGALNREGSRFWIVRPQLSLTQIQGLETAVGAKYIGVSPGDPNGGQLSQFEGLAQAPPDELDHGGLQIVLRSDDRHGLSPGASVSWRGVKVGRVLSVNLSPDARHVHTTVRISRSYRKLIRSTSKFWVTSGFGVDMGISGVKLNANSLSTILEGGVSFVTIADEESGGPVSDGQVFSLVKDPDKNWFRKEASIPLVDFEPPETVMVTGQYSVSTLGISRTKSFSQNGILVKTKNSVLVVTASLPESEDDLPDAIIQVTQPGKPAIDVDVKAVSDFGEGTVSIDVKAVRDLSARASVSLKELQPLTQAEDCLLFRSAVVDGKATPVMQTIDLERIVLNDGRWLIQDDDIDSSEWHGAPVLAVSSGKIVGVLSTVDGHAQIAGRASN